MDKIIVTIIGLLAMGFVYWFFLMKKEKAVQAEKSIDIIVKGGYLPEIISVPQGQPTVINFKRIDQNSCLEEVVMPEFKIRKYLPVNQTVPVNINPSKTGEFPFSCGMGMYHGKIIVK
ncbi:MAG: cupredoxin domain-containing protein [Patescibacteria group bacterium]|nr:cupredoxin domain-containing protein [Patescibacteria group bacterium]